MTAPQQRPGEPDHTPARPSWRCVVPTCRRPWPCPPAQAAISAAIVSGTTDRAGQMFYLSGRMIEAAQDLAADELPDPYGRFLGWLTAPVQQPERGTAGVRSVDPAAGVR